MIKVSINLWEIASIFIYVFIISKLRLVLG
jgi:hypothetical protein